MGDEENSNVCLLQQIRKQNSAVVVGVVFFKCEIENPQRHPFSALTLHKNAIDEILKRFLSSHVDGVAGCVFSSVWLFIWLV